MGKVSYWKWWKIVAKRPLISGQLDIICICHGRTINFRKLGFFSYRLRIKLICKKYERSFGKMFSFLEKFKQGGKNRMYFQFENTIGYVWCDVNVCTLYKYTCKYRLTLYIDRVTVLVPYWPGPNHQREARSGALPRVSQGHHQQQALSARSDQVWKWIIVLRQFQHHLCWNNQYTWRMNPHGPIRYDYLQYRNWGCSKQF